MYDTYVAPLGLCRLGKMPDLRVGSFNSSSGARCPAYDGRGNLHLPAKIGQKTEN